MPECHVWPVSPGVPDVLMEQDGCFEGFVIPKPFVLPHLFHLASHFTKHEFLLNMIILIGYRAPTQKSLMRAELV